MEFWDGSGISWTICKQSAPRCRQKNTATPRHSFFTSWMLFLTPNQQCQSAEGRILSFNIHIIITVYTVRSELHFVLQPVVEIVLCC